MRESSIPSAQFCSEPKTDLLKSLLFKVPTCTNLHLTPSEYVSYSNLSEREPNGANES